MVDRFTCAQCGDDFITAWTEAEAMAEMVEREGYVPASELVTVCDPCYQRMEANRVAHVERYRPGNDALWGPGNWVMCMTCPPAGGRPVFHHKDAHG